MNIQPRNYNALVMFWVFCLHFPLMLRFFAEILATASLKRFAGTPILLYVSFESTVFVTKIRF